MEYHYQTPEVSYQPTEHAAKMDHLDRLAEELHNGWWKFQLNHGLKLGPDKIDERTKPRQPKKNWMHPHMSAWSGKCTTDKNQDRYEAAIILHSWFTKNLTKESLAKMIHESWREWMKINGIQNHPHDHPFEHKNAHADGLREHSEQADRVYKFLNKNFPKN